MFVHFSMLFARMLFALSIFGILQRLNEVKSQRLDLLRGVLCYGLLCCLLLNSLSFLLHLLSCFLSRLLCCFCCCWLSLWFESCCLCLCLDSFDLVCVASLL